MKSEHLAAGHARKLAEGSREFTQYKSEMLRNQDGKTRVFLDAMLRHRIRLKRHSLVVDLGSCTGNICGALADHIEFRKSKIIGLDLSQSFLAQAAKDHEKANFVLSNVCQLPLPPNSTDIFIASSIFHEVFSYQGPNGKRLSHENAINFLKSVNRALKRGGHLLLKDPAKPENPDEVLQFSINNLQGHDSIVLDHLLRHPIRELSLRARWVLFLHQFVPLIDNKRLQKQLLMQVSQSTFTFKCPAWVLSEFLRHRTLCVTDGNWKSEMNEQYGVYTADEFSKVARRLGFRVRESQAKYRAQNYSAIKNNEITIADKNCRTLDRGDRLPTNLFVVLQKK